MDVDQEKVAEQEAALLAIQSQVNTHQLEAARIELKMLEKDLAYYEEELERTKILMPNDGTILTLHLKDLEKKYLKKGDKFADVEDARTVRIEISIPEADIGLVDIGNSARFRLQTFAEETIEGKISGIYPATEKTDYGVIVKVVCLVPNEGYSLKSGMTGKAKVAGRKLFVFQVFSRVLLNFVRIELWSWLP
jgi:putative peptide zinc metalloprotease protein